jgi:hypothetical protein
VNKCKALSGRTKKCKFESGLLTKLCKLFSGRVNASFFDADNDGDSDLLVVSGGNEWSEKSPNLQPRLYINQNGNLNKCIKLDISVNGSVVRPVDFDKDGDIDVFIGGRSIPWKYGIKPDSYLLINDGKGNFKIAGEKTVEPLKSLGFVKDAKWTDVDSDGDHDLVIASEWLPITFLINDNGILKLMNNKSTGLDDSNGLWNSVEVNDFDKDGDPDFVFGNLGLNSKLKSSRDYPVRLYVNDFDKNGTIDQILTHYMHGKEYPFYTKDEMTKQLPYLKKNFLSYKKFSESTLTDIFSKDELAKSEVLEAKRFDHVFVENLGGNKFKLTSLPKGTQFSTVNTFTSGDFNGDGFVDVLTAGNYYPINVQMGRYDASYGSLLLGGNKNTFHEVPPFKSGISLTGEVRVLRQIRVGPRIIFIAARNNDSVEMFEFRKD